MYFNNLVEIVWNSGTKVEIQNLFVCKLLEYKYNVLEYIVQKMYLSNGCPSSKAPATVLQLY